MQQRTVLVTGATGKQGGSVARALLAKGHRVLAVTRSPQSDAAKALAVAGATVVRGDFRDPVALAAALRGADTVYAMGTPFTGGAAQEVREGIAIIDAARATGVGHVIYSSVASADRSTGVPHFDSKLEVERHLVRTIERYTISAPVAFIDFANPVFLEGLRKGELRMPMPATRLLQYVSVADIGAFAAVLVERREQVFGRRFEIAGDEITGEQCAAALSKATNSDIRYVAVPVSAIRAHSEDLALMFEWLVRTGYSVDRAALRREFPEMQWQSVEEWARAQDWPAALKSNTRIQPAESRP